MKVIDLLNKIANGEEVPKKYRYKNMEYEEDYCYMLYEATGDCNELGFKSLLNDEVEVIEEDKKIEKLDKDNFNGVGNLEISGQCATQFDYVIEQEIDDIVDKINEIIDKINEEK